MTRNSDGQRTYKGKTIWQALFSLMMMTMMVMVKIIGTFQHGNGAHNLHHNERYRSRWVQQEFGKWGRDSSNNSGSTTKIVSSAAYT